MGNASNSGDESDDLNDVNFARNEERRKWLNQTNFQRQKTLEDINYLHFLYNKYCETGRESWTIEDRDGFCDDFIDIFNLKEDDQEVMELKLNEEVTFNIWKDWICKYFSSRIVPFESFYGGTELKE
eukprot:gene8019-12484_t